MLLRSCRPPHQVNWKLFAGVLPGRVSPAVSLVCSGQRGSGVLGTEEGSSVEGDKLSVVLLRGGGQDAQRAVSAGQSVIKTSYGRSAADVG